MIHRAERAGICNYHRYCGYYSQHARCRSRRQTPRRTSKSPAHGAAHPPAGRSPTSGPSSPRSTSGTASPASSPSKSMSSPPARPSSHRSSLELSLRQPVATRPDDLLESTLICFLSNLRPAVRNLKYVPRPHVLSVPLTACSPENIQSYLSNYISDQLATTSEWTVWDRPWPINEENRGSCCTDDPDRAELGRLRYQGEPAADRVQRNPLKRMEEKGGGLFELDWAERARLLRQLVDWQCRFPSRLHSRCMWHVR